MKLVIYEDALFGHRRLFLGKILSEGEKQLRITAIQSQHFSGYRSRINKSDAIIIFDKEDANLEFYLTQLETASTIDREYAVAKDNIKENYKVRLNQVIETIKKEAKWLS